MTCEAEKFIANLPVTQVKNYLSRSGIKPRQKDGHLMYVFKDLSSITIKAGSKFFIYAISRFKA